MSKTGRRKISWTSVLERGLALYHLIDLDMATKSPARGQAAGSITNHKRIDRGMGIRKWLSY